MTLSALQKRTYDSEAENNFRWIFSFLATKSSRVLASADLMDEDVHSQLSQIGEYAELAHGSISPSFVFRNLAELCTPGGPLEDYGALKGEMADLVSQFKGDVADLQGYVAFRPGVRQLIVAFSGTSTHKQALRDIQTWRTAYPYAERSTVHTGFLEMYRGIRSNVYEALSLGFQKYESQVKSVVLTGHSMGCTTCYLLALDLMEGRDQNIPLPRGIKITLAAFGSPRLGNIYLAKYWRDTVSKYIDTHGEGSFVEYSVKGYNDGVPALPPFSLGFRHLTETPLYFYHGCLYRVPASENEHGMFTVVNTTTNASNFEIENKSAGPQPDPITSSHARQSTLSRITWPRGGHNYYNDRDMEKLQRRMRWLNVTTHGEQGWQERYVHHLKRWEQRWGMDVQASH